MNAVIVKKKAHHQLLTKTFPTVRHFLDVKLRKTRHTHMHTNLHLEDISLMSWPALQNKSSACV